MPRFAHTSDVSRTSRRWWVGSRESREDARAPRSRLRTGRTLKRRMPRDEEMFFARSGKREVFWKMGQKKPKVGPVL
jgi:hypothetical protein